MLISHLTIHVLIHNFMHRHKCVISKHLALPAKPNSDHASCWIMLLELGVFLNPSQNFTMSLKLWSHTLAPSHGGSFISLLPLGCNRTTTKPQPSDPFNLWPNYHLVVAQSTCESKYTKKLVSQGKQGHAHQPLMHSSYQSMCVGNTTLNMWQISSFLEAILASPNSEHTSGTQLPPAVISSVW